MTHTVTASYDVPLCSFVTSLKELVKAKQTNQQLRKSILQMNSCATYSNYTDYTPRAVTTQTYAIGKKVV